MFSLDFRQTFDNILLSLGKPQLLRFVSVKPRYLILRVTENCNSRCITCNAWKNRYDDELTTEEMRDILRQCRDCGIDGVRLTGGEPLVRTDIADIVRECDSLGFRDIYIGTNGLLLEEKAEELIENGVTHFGVSIDGIGKTNDVIRGVSDAYKRSVEGINLVKAIKKEKGLKLPAVSVFTTILKQNIDQIPEIIKACKKLGVRWGFNLLDANIHLFEGIDAPNLVVQDEKKIDGIMDYLKKLRRRLPKVIYACEHVIEFARDYLKNNQRAHQVPCILGYYKLLVRSHGEIYPGCPILGSIGNFRKDKLADVLKSKEYREYAERMYMRKCPGCSFFCADSPMIKHILSHRFKCQVMGF